MDLSNQFVQSLEVQEEMILGPGHRMKRREVYLRGYIPTSITTYVYIYIYLGMWINAFFSHSLSMPIILGSIMIINMIALLLSYITLVVGQRTEIPDFASSSMTVASSQLDQLAQFALDETKKVIHHSKGNCTLENLRFRRDWRAFSTTEKKAYLESVLCLQALPSRTPSTLAPGAKTRYDDFVATHINQTGFIHRSVWAYMIQYA